MGDIKILDTGKLYVGGTLASGEARAYGDSGVGTALTLNTAEASVNYEAMVSSDSPVSRMKDNTSTGYFEYGESDSNGIQLPVWTVRGYVNRINEDDMITLGRLLFMCQTKGYKELYSSTTADFSSMVNQQRQLHS
jgi:hypothetical protein